MELDKGTNFLAIQRLYLGVTSTLKKGKINEQFMYQ